MSLTTRAKVLQTLGLTDDSSAESAIAVSVTPASMASYTLAVNSGQTTLTATPSVGSPTVYTLTAAAYDTLAEVASALSALTGLDAEVVTGLDSTLPSTLLTASQSVTINSSDTLGQLTYTNTAAGTVAAFIDQLILDVDAAIARMTGRTFASGTITETYDGDGTPDIQLASWPVTSVTSVTEIDDSGSESTVGSGLYRVDLLNGRLVRQGARYGLIGSSADGWPDVEAQFGPAREMGWFGGWTPGFQNYRVVYVAGYSSVPDDLSRVATDMVVELYLNRRADFRASSESVQGLTTQYRSADDIARRYRDRLSPFVCGSLGAG